MKYYHASLASGLPSKIVPTEEYESTKHGCPQPRFGDPSLGFIPSNVPQIAFSKRPEAAAFAVAENIALSYYEQDEKNKIPNSKLYIYSTEQKPDVLNTLSISISLNVNPFH
jgi:hypothetical protein